MRTIVTWVRQNHAPLGIVASSVLPLFFYAVGTVIYWSEASHISRLRS